MWELFWTTLKLSDASLSIGLRDHSAHDITKINKCIVDVDGLTNNCPLTCNMIVRTWNAKKVKTHQFHDHYSISLQEYQCMLLIQISFGIGVCPCGCGYAYASSTGQESLGLSSYTWIEFESEFKVREKEHKCNACGGWVWLTGPGGWCGIGFVRKLASGSSRLWPNLVSSSS